MLMILARLVRSESFWAVAKVRSPHTGPEPGYPRRAVASGAGRSPGRSHKSTSPGPRHTGFFLKVGGGYFCAQTALLGR